jgi:tryptophan synthase alpha chain
MNNADRLEASLRSPRRPGPAVVAHLVGGYPSRTAFPGVLARVSEVADAVAIALAVPEPLADGSALQRAADEALTEGATLAWLLESLATHRAHCPALLVCYVEPMVAHGPTRLIDDLATLAIDGLMVPDLDHDGFVGGSGDDASLAEAAAAAGIALAALVTPDTPEEHLPARCEPARGLVCAATTTGTTGGALDVGGAAGLLDRVRPHARVPLCAGFGIRRPDQARRLAPHADGLFIGAALVEAISQGRDPATVLDALRAAAAGIDAAATRRTR